MALTNNAYCIEGSYKQHNLQFNLEDLLDILHNLRFELPLKDYPNMQILLSYDDLSDASLAFVHPQ